MRWIVAGAGALAAAFAGAVAGGLVKPEFGSLVGQLSAPRLETASAGRRAAPENLAEIVDPDADADAATSFDENLPDYVVGTDWLPPKFEADVTPVDAAEVAPVQVTSATAAAPKPRAMLVLGKTAEPLRTAPPALAANGPSRTPSAF